MGIVAATAVGLTTIALFAIPESASQSVKVVWFLVATVLVPMLRPKLGWFVGCVVFVAVFVIMMIPMMFSVKERHSETSIAEENPATLVAAGAAGDAS